jgi:hypothetical protein
MAGESLIRDMPPEERPRQRFLRVGGEASPDASGRWAMLPRPTQVYDRVPLFLEGLDDGSGDDPPG